MATTPGRRPPSLPRIDPVEGTNNAYGVDMVSRGRGDYDAIVEAGGDPDATPVTPDEIARADALRKRHARAIRNFKTSSSADEDQRRAELDDLKYARARLEDHWTAGDITRRSGETNGESGKPGYGRPMLVLDKLAVPKRQTMNEARNARLSIRIKAKAGRATKKNAQLVQDAVRAIEVDSRAHIARNWALDRVITCGRGYYRIETKYANDKDRDLDIVVSRILNQFAVYPDPWRKEPDGSDMKFCLITEDIPTRDYPDRYPDSKLAKKIRKALEEQTYGEILAGSVVEDGTDAQHEGGALTGTGDTPPGWITEATIRVAEHFYVEYERRTKLWVPTGQGHQEMWADEIPPTVQLPPDVLKREIVTPVVRWEVLNGEEILDEEQWPGRFIPIVEVVGEEHNVNGERTFKGIYTVGKDANRSYEYHRSAQVEAVALAPRAPYIAAEGQTELYPEWDTANSENHSVLVYKPTSHDGHLMPPPQRNTSEPAIQAITIAAQAADQDIKDITGRHEASLGQYSSERSGKAVQSLQQQAQVGSSHFLTNLAEISMAYEARIIVDLLPHIYDRPGRVMRLLGERDQEEYAIVGAPFVQTPDGPQAVPVPPGMPPEGMVGQSVQMPGMAKPQRTKLYTFDADADYTIAVGVGPSTQSAKDQNSESIRAIMEAAPALAPLMADLLASQMEGDIAEQLSARIKAVQPAIANLPGDEDDDSDMSPEAMAKIQGLTMQLQQMQQQLQEATTEIQTRRSQYQTQLMIAQESNASRERTVLATTRTQLAIAQMNGGGKVDVATLQGEIDAAMGESQQAHDVLMARLEASLEAQLSEDQDQRAARAGDRDETRAVRGDVRKELMAGSAASRQRALAREQREGDEQRASRDGVRQDVQAERADARKGALAAATDRRQAQIAEAATGREARATKPKAAKS